LGVFAVSNVLTDTTARSRLGVRLDKAQRGLLGGVKRAGGGASQKINVVQLPDFDLAEMPRTDEDMAACV
jgi:hypothetical protein